MFQNCCDDGISTISLLLAGSEMSWIFHQNRSKRPQKLIINSRADKKRLIEAFFRIWSQDFENRQFSGWTWKFFEISSWHFKHPIKLNFLIWHLEQPYLDQKSILEKRPFKSCPFNLQTEYLHKKVNFQLFKKCCFWGCDVENWVWTKLALWICPILWIRVKIGYTQLSLTFFHYYRPIRPIYQKIKKIIFPKKMTIFGSKMCSRGAKSGSIGIAR